jgi:tRNA threonylcarbamoyl adenosine modification protein (Sua5/YciO/YrdC/YwlC family)
VLLQVDPLEPEPWLLAKAVDALRRGGVVVTPTDSVYAIACGISHPDAIRRVYALKDMDPKKPLSILLPDTSMISRYARGVSTPVYRMMKRVLPGPYTFIFGASNEVPKIMLRKRRTIGIRIPNNPILLALLAELDDPLLTTSVRTADDEVVTDPIDLEGHLGSRIDLVIDGGIQVPQPSTVVDLSGDVPVLLREGKGDVDALQLFD